MKYKVRDGYVFVTMDKTGNRIAHPNMTEVDDKNPAHAAAIKGQRQMHKLEPLVPEKKAPKEETVPKEPKKKKEPKRTKAAKRPARGGRGR